MTTQYFAYVYSIQWSPAGGAPPEIYQPSLSGTPYPYLFAYAGTKQVLELNENNSRSDNSFYQKLTVPRPSMRPLITPASDSIFFVNRVVEIRDSILLNVALQDL